MIKKYHLKILLSLIYFVCIYMFLFVNINSFIDNINELISIFINNYKWLATTHEVIGGSHSEGILEAKRRVPSRPLVKHKIIMKCVAAHIVRHKSKMLKIQSLWSTLCSATNLQHFNFTDAS